VVIVLTGVAGAGKTTIAAALARRLQSELFEGDDFHPRPNREKMRAGMPLTDEDREPWLIALGALIADLLTCGVDGVLTCSALRQSYRDFLAREDVHFVYLRIAYDVALARLQKRAGHYFEADLLASQFETLEEPSEGLTVDANQPVDRVVIDIVQGLPLTSA
jgi:gluconokinase